MIISINASISMSSNLNTKLLSLSFSIHVLSAQFLVCFSLVCHSLSSYIFSIDLFLSLYPYIFCLSMFYRRFLSCFFFLSVLLSVFVFLSCTVSQVYSKFYLQIICLCPLVCQSDCLSVSLLNIYPFFSVLLQRVWADQTALEGVVAPISSFNSVYQ